MHHSTDRITHTTAFVTPIVEHWLEREIAQWVHPMKNRSDDPSHHERTLYLWATSRSLLCGRRQPTSSNRTLQRFLIYIAKFRGCGPWAPLRSVTDKILQPLWYTIFRNKENVLLNDVLNTFYLRLYGVRHVVKNHSDSKTKPAAATIMATLFD